MKRILITGTGGDVAAGIVRCILADMPEATLFSCDLKEIIPYLDRFKQHFVVPDYNNEAYWPTIVSICEHYKITHFFPTTEPEILIANRHQEYFSTEKIHLIINNNQIIQTTTSKYRTASFLRENGICVPDTYLITNLPSDLIYPLIIKPDFGRGSAHFTIAHTQQDLLKALETISSPVIQQYVGDEDHEYTVSVFSDGNDVCSIAFRRKLGRGSMSVFVEVVRDNEVERIAYNVAKIFELRGSFNIQLRYENGFYYIFEINPRISSTVSFRHKMGFKDVIWWIKLLSGDILDTQCSIPVGAIGIKVDEEQIFYDTSNIKFMQYLL